MVDVKKELTEQQKRFEIAANITSDVIWEWRPKQNKVWWGEGIETAFGYSREEYEHPEFWQNHILPEDREGDCQSMKQAEEEGTDSWQEENWIIDATGGKRRMIDEA